MPSELKDLLDRAADRPSAEPDFAALARTGRRRRYTQRAASALAVVAVIALTSTLVIPKLRPPPQVAFDTAPRSGVGTWDAVPASPLGARESAQAFGDGDRVVVYGGIEWVEQGDPMGDISRYDGAVYDIGDRSWTTFPAPPLEFTPADIVPDVRLLDDGRLMVLTEDLAAGFYDFRAEQWEVTDAAPLSARGAAVVEWTGDRLVVWGGWSEAGDRGDGAVWHRDSGWTSMARSPLSARSGVASAWTGDRLLVWGGAAGDITAGEQRVFADGASYDPVTNRWTPMAPAPLSARQEPMSHWTGKGWILIGGMGPEAADLSTSEPDVQMTEHCEGGRCTAEASASVGIGEFTPGEEFVDGARYDPRSDTWTPTTLPPERFRKRGIGMVAGRIVTGTNTQEATYDPASDSWDVVDRPGTNPMWDAYDVGGTTVILNSGENLGMNDQDRPRRLGGVVYDRDADRWDTLSEADTAQRSSPATAVAGNRLFVWGGLSVTRDMDGYQGEPGAWHRHDDGAVLTLD